MLTWFYLCIIYSYAYILRQYSEAIENTACNVIFDLKFFVIKLFKYYLKVFDEKLYCSVFFSVGFQNGLDKFDEPTSLTHCLKR